jgi:O-antigen/teichoic acid export membrane protein
MGAIRKTFLSNLLLLIGINLLIKPFYLLVIEASIQERLGPDAYGMYFALLNISFILNILPDIGITNWNNRHVASSGIIQASQFQKLIRLRILLGLVYLLVCTGVGLFMDYEEHALAWLIVLAFNQVLSTGVLFLRSYLTGMHAFASDRFVSILDRLLLIGMMGAALLWIPRDEVFPISYFIYGQTIAYGATLLVSFILVVRLTPKEGKNELLSTDTILTSSLPFALLIFFSMISGRVDAVLLERMKGTFDAGIYAMAFRLGDMLTMISYLFAVLLLPMFSRQLANEEQPRDLFGISFRLLLTGCAWMALISVFQAEYILKILYNEHTSEAALVLPWTIGAAVMFSLQYATGTLLTAGHKMKLLIVVALLSLGVNISINTKLIPCSGAVGAAQAAFITQTFVFLIQAVFIQKYYRVWTMRLLIQSTLFISVSFVSGSLIASANLSAVLTAGSITGSVVLIGILTSMLPVRDIKKILPITHQVTEES